MINIDKIIKELEKDDWANGDLCLFIACKKCNAQFELNNETCALAMILNTPFIEYVKYIQNSKCRVCDITGIEKIK